MSYEVLKRLHLPVYYYYALCFIEHLELIYLLCYEVQHIFYDNLDNGYLDDTSQSIFLRDIIHDRVALNLTEFIIILVASVYLAIIVSLCIVTVIVGNNDQLLRKPTQKQMQSVGWSRWTEILRLILEGYFRGIGHILILISTVLIVPSMIFFAEVERCIPPGGSNTNS